MPEPPDDALGWAQRPDRETSLLFDVFVLGNRVRALVGASMREAALRPDEYAAYSVLFEARAITQTGLAERLGLPLTTVADHVRAMEARRHLRRRAHPTDGRSTLLSLSAEGLRAHRRASRAFELAAASLERHLGSDAEARAVLRRVADAADAALISLPQRRAG